MGYIIVHIIQIEGDDPDADNIREVEQILVFGTLEFEFPGEGRLGLDPVFQGGRQEACLVKDLFQPFVDPFGNFCEQGLQPAVFFQDARGVQVQMVVL